MSDRPASGVPDTTAIVASASTEADGGEALSPTGERFAMLLEKRMLEGHSDAANRSWATTSMGVPYERFIRIKALIVRSWSIEASTWEGLCEQRDSARAKYLEIYRLAIERENLPMALRALDSIVKLDGLEREPVSPTTVNVSLGTGITNNARETVARLIAKAKDLATTKTMDNGPITITPASNSMNGNGRH